MSRTYRKRGLANSGGCLEFDERSDTKGFSELRSKLGSKFNFGVQSPPARFFKEASIFLFRRCEKSSTSAASPAWLSTWFHSIIARHFRSVISCYLRLLRSKGILISLRYESSLTSLARERWIDRTLSNRSVCVSGRGHEAA